MTEEKQVEYLEVHLMRYHGTTVGRLVYTWDGERIESRLYTVPEINNILRLWPANELLGTFGMHKLSPTARIQVLEEKYPPSA